MVEIPVSTSDIIDTFIKSGLDYATVSTFGKPPIAIYNSLKSYIKRHNLSNDMRVRMIRGSVILIKKDYEQQARIEQFIKNEWDKDYAYTASDISQVLGCNIRLSRYYLMEMVKCGVLHQIKHRGRTWYVLYDQAKLFAKYKQIGVHIR